MLTKDYVIEHYNDFESQPFNRLGVRLAQFCTKEELKKLNIFTDESIEEWDDSKVKDWTEENIIEQLRKDVEFGFEKALNQRGISASIMFDIVLTWNQILENYLKDWNPEDYPMYGLPLFKATALLYGFDNPIGDDSGSEEYYNEEDYYYEDDDL